MTASTLGLLALMLALLAVVVLASFLPARGWAAEALSPVTKGVVALLSLIWMSGVLAAQIQGGVAVLELLGLEKAHSYMTILLLIYGASRLDLRFASALRQGARACHGVLPCAARRRFSATSSVGKRLVT